MTTLAAIILAPPITVVALAALCPLGLILSATRAWNNARQERRMWREMRAVARRTGFDLPERL